MGPVQEAVWFVEGHLGEAITLESIAEACFVSPYHLTRAFAATTGASLMRYVRHRRMTEAARRLAAGAPDILRLALDLGYGSHEGFTRAFREHFGCPPEAVRRRGNLDDLELTETATMTTPAPETRVRPPRLETGRAMRLVGLVERHDCDATGRIPGQWLRLGPYFATADRVDGTAYGVCFGHDGSSFDYMAGFEVRGDVPAGLVELQVPEQRYAVFQHEGHVTGIGASFVDIWNRAIPEAGLTPVEGPSLECYGPGFDSRTGLGDIEIRIPVES